MACLLTADLLLDCKDQVGGLKEVLVTELANKNSITKVGGVVTVFDLTTGNQFFKYELPQATSQWTETINASPANGTLFYQSEVALVLHKREVQKRNEIKLLAQNRVMVIVLDRSGKYWLVGEENGAELTAGSGVTGTAHGDLTGYNLTLTAMEGEPAYEVASGLIAALLIPAP